jgi:hypothetical protein
VIGALVLSFLVLPSSPAAAGNGTVHVGEGESIQAAIDAAAPGTTIQVRGDHAEQLWIYKDGITLDGKGATLSMPDEPDFEGPCGPTLICVITDNENDFENPFDPDNVYVSDVTVSGFTLSNPFYDSIGTYWTTGAAVERNTVPNSGCSGIFMLFANDFTIERNVVSSSAECSNIDVAASDGGTIGRNTSTDGGFAGINIDDVSNVVIDRNTSTGNCIGIVAANSPGPLPSSNVTITRNTTNGNNTVCFPFGPPEEGGPPIGVTGILVVGPTDVLVSRNTVEDNTAEAFTITAGGIVVQDFAFNNSSDVVIERNTASGNSSLAGPADISVGSVGGPFTVTDNICEFGVPDASWCTN